jgi:hypothetical protein
VFAVEKSLGILTVLMSVLKGNRPFSTLITPTSSALKFLMLYVLPEPERPMQNTGIAMYHFSFLVNTSFGTLAAGLFG